MYYVHTSEHCSLADKCAVCCVHLTKKKMKKPLKLLYDVHLNRCARDEDDLMRNNDNSNTTATKPQPMLTIGWRDDDDDVGGRAK